MAGRSAVALKVKRFKVQLSDTAEADTVVKILQKLKDLDITLDVLAETGIGKTVNALRRHEQAGEFAKSLVRGWKRLVPKESSSLTEDGDAPEGSSFSQEQRGGLVSEDLNNNYLTSQDKSPDLSEEVVPKEKVRRTEPEKKEKKQKTHKSKHEGQEKCQKESPVREDLQKRVQIQEKKSSKSVISKKKKKKKNQERAGQENEGVSKKDVSEKIHNQKISKRRKMDPSDRKSGDEDPGNQSPEEPDQKTRCFSGERIRSSSERTEKEARRRSKTSQETSQEHRHSSSFTAAEKTSRTQQLDEDRNDKSARRSKQSNRKRKMDQRVSPELEDSEQKNKKSKSNDQEVETEHSAESSRSFESFLNYDVNILKRKEKPAKKAVRKIRTLVKEDPGVKPAEMKSFNESVLDLMNVPLPAVLMDFDKPSCFDYYERKVEKDSELCEVPEESAGFTGQRLNKKMQVYSGAKTMFLPSMMSLHQQCIRTLQNNINLLYETGGVPFEILEPVLERCTPEQLLRIEECNPIYVGETDHLWGKHCQRDFRDSRLEEYESWKEMYIRLSEERERKLQRLTKSIISAHSSKPKGRQVKMAFIHTVAKPPRDVRIQQELHGTAAQPPPPPPPPPHRCSVKVQENRLRPGGEEPSRSSSCSAGAANTADPRRRTKVAPMMAKSLKAFKKQFGRR